MIHASPMHWLLAATSTRTYWQFARLDQLTTWWHWLGLGVLLMAVIAYVFAVYRRDRQGVPHGVGTLLLVLRIAALLGLLMFFLDLEQRSERRVTKTSRAVLLIDTSQSMGLIDAGSSDRLSRLQTVIRELNEGKLTNTLRTKHEIAAYTFGGAEAPHLIGVLPRVDAQATSDDASDSARQTRIAHTVTWAYRAVAIFLLVALTATVLHFALGQRSRGAEGEAYGLLVSTFALLIALVIAATTHLRYPDVDWRGLSHAASQAATESQGGTDDDRATPATLPNWSELLVARSTETRLGDALRWILDRERESPVAGIILVTDGRSNGGTAPEDLITAVQSADIPLYPIGIGATEAARSVRVADLEAPPRVYPGDRFAITGYIQAHGLSGRTATVQLRPADDTNASAAVTTVEERRITLGEDGALQAVPFELTPQTPGRQNWKLEITLSGTEDLDPRDNVKQATIEVVDRKNRVLLFAGGPNRDYHFLRNLLYRDQHTEVDVLLQSAAPGAAQESHEVLLEFPSTREDLFAYDAMVAFDPNWNLLTADQVALLDEWVAEKAGGLVVVAGPVFTQQWTRGDRSTADESKLAKIRDLYPVTFYSRGAASIQLGRVGSDTPWPLQFTDEGRRASFLALEDSPGASEEAWQRFAGIFGYQAIKGLKPGAQVLARFSDPQTTIDGEAPVYLAEHFYGAGRVLYVGSGEFWRLNDLDTRYFETLYTKIIRHVSQGRLLRDSSHGVLLTDQERASLGDPITIRAVLSDAQYRPLKVDSVPALVNGPDGSRQTLSLLPLAHAERPGMYTAQFTATQEGEYRIDLVVPGVDNDVLTRTIKVRVPARETENSQRNDALLSQLAQQTQGHYFVGWDAARGEQGVVALAQHLKTKDQVSYIPSAPDARFDRHWMGWLMTWIVGCLSLEWLGRRWFRLA